MKKKVVRETHLYQPIYRFIESKTNSIKKLELLTNHLGRSKLMSRKFFGFLDLQI